MKKMKKLTHLEHIEDLILVSGIEGAETSLSILQGLISNKNECIVQIKFDGAPSIVAGYEPKSGNFFVGTKSVFNVTPKLYFNENDIKIDDSLSSGLKHKLSCALKYLPWTIKSGVWQGDFMFTRSDVMIDNPQISFKPNTITYSTDNKELIESIIKARLGIIWHTKYNGTSLSTLEADFCADTSVIGNHHVVWTVKPDIKYEFDGIERTMINAGIDHLKRLLKLMNVSVVQELLKRSEVSMILKRFINSRCRDGKTFTNKYEMIVDLGLFIKNMHDKNAAKLITEKGKQKKQDQYISLMTDLFRKKETAEVLMNIFQYHAWIQQIKNMIIQKLETFNIAFQHTIDDKPTGSEGFVVFDKKSAIATKLVNRLEFSRANFNMEKSW